MMRQPLFAVVQPVLLLATVCGLALAGGEQNYIVDGSDVPIGRYPYVVTLQSAFRHECGGVLVAPDMVVSAAHCIDNGIFEVRLGRRALSDPNMESYAVVDKVPHPAYSPTSDTYDIALLKLHKGSSIKPLRLNADPTVPQDETVDLTVMGWGHDGTGYFPDIMQETVVQYVPNEVCQSAGGSDPSTWYSNWLFDDMLCALGDGKDSCAGDSGGPLIVRGSTSVDDLLVGTVSWGIYCGVYPGVYARVSYSFDWLSSVICEMSVDPPAYLGCVIAETPSPTRVPTYPPTPAPTPTPGPTPYPTVGTTPPTLPPTLGSTNLRTIAPTSVAPVPAPTFLPTPIPTNLLTTTSSPIAPLSFPSSTGNGAFPPTDAPSTALGRETGDIPMTNTPSVMDPTSSGAVFALHSISVMLCGAVTVVLTFLIRC